MRDGDGATGHARGLSSSGPAIQVICLGSGGGPSEDNVTGFLVRSTASNWAKGSLLAVDAGSHLAAITRILQNDFPLVSRANEARDTHSRSKSENGEGDHGSVYSPSTYSRASSEQQPLRTLSDGPFAGLPFPHESARANAVHVVREHVATYLITHPHLDHLSGFAINTAAFHNTSRPKRLAALPFTVGAIKAHIFNDVIWPNLTDEDGGVGFVTFQRLAEGGNIALGEGYGRGFIEVCDGLAVKGLRVSHGHRLGAPAHLFGGNGQPNAEPVPGHLRHSSTQPLPFNGNSTNEQRSQSISMGSQPGTPYSAQHSDLRREWVTDSTAYFIRDEASGREVLIFGDVEPDSISLVPRTAQVWAEAAPKIAAGILSGIFIECSYNDSQGDAILFGHLAPRHLIKELQTLAELVKTARAEESRMAAERTAIRKRKRISNASADQKNRSLSRGRRSFTTDQVGARASVLTGDVMGELESPLLAAQFEQNVATAGSGSGGGDSGGPLRGVRVVIIHVKDTFADGPPVGESILADLNEHEAALREQGGGLGCTFDISVSGGSYWF